MNELGPGWVGGGREYPATSKHTPTLVKDDCLSQRGATFLAWECLTHDGTGLARRRRAHPSPGRRFKAES